MERNANLTVTFEKAEQWVASGDTAGLLKFLADHFRNQQQYPELFEILKMEARHELGLAIDNRSDTNSLSDQQQRELEDRLLNICLEIGRLYVERGDIVEAWRYLQAVIDQAEVARIIETVEPDDENIDSVIDIALGQWAAPAFGYRLLLEHQGTCNGITFFDSQIVYQIDSIRQPLAELLIRHIDAQLCDNVSSRIAETAPGFRTTDSLQAMIAERPWLFENFEHHIDPTHLASAVRIARYCGCEESLSKAVGLCEYGIQLGPEIQYPADPPFENNFQDHLIYFRGLLQFEVEAAIAHFKKKQTQLSGTEFEPAVVDAIVQLCDRSGRSGDAIEFMLSAGNVEISAVLGIAKTQTDFQRLKQYFRSKDDLLAYSLCSLFSVKR